MWLTRVENEGLLPSQKEKSPYALRPILIPQLVLETQTRWHFFSEKHCQLKHRPCKSANQFYKYRKYSEDSEFAAWKYRGGQAQGNLEQREIVEEIRRGYRRKESKRRSLLRFDREHHYSQASLTATGSNKRLSWRSAHSALHYKSGLRQQDVLPIFGKPSAARPETHVL